MEKKLQARSGNKCEICGSTSNLSVYDIKPERTGGIDDKAYLCDMCKSQIEDTETIDQNHWRCLNDSMWSEHEAVKVLSYRMLNHLSAEVWAQDLLEMFYLDNELVQWAKAGQVFGDSVKHLDSNGNVLERGDSVVLIKSLDVKGSSLTAKKGTVVKKITLVEDNPEQIEGKVEGQHIVILCKFVKKGN